MGGAGYTHLLDNMRALAFIIFAGVHAAISQSIDVNPPKGWVEQEHTPQGVVVLFTKPVVNAEFSENLAISHYEINPLPSYNITIDSLINMVRKNQMRSFPLYEIHEKGSRVINGIEGGYLICSYVRGEINAKVLQFFFLDGNSFLNVVYTSLAKDFDKWRSVFEESLETLTYDSEASE